MVVSFSSSNFRQFREADLPVVSLSAVEPGRFAGGPKHCGRSSIDGMRQLGQERVGSWGAYGSFSLRINVPSSKPDGGIHSDGRQGLGVK